jgi:hypothetical protein
MGKSKQDDIINNYLARFPSGLHFTTDAPEDDHLPQEDVQKLSQGDDELDFSALTFENIDMNNTNPNE